jgi:hypothetical protein
MTQNNITKEETNEQNKEKNQLTKQKNSFLLFKSWVTQNSITIKTSWNTND